MKWSNVRNIYPNRWVLVEALATHSNNHQRTIEEMSVVSEYDDPKDAWASYKKLHLSEPTRELYIFYTGNEYIEVIEQPFTGIRGLR
ncbi:MULTISPECIES: hypothetical protein [Paenibacillus]|uniref:hypothetical protein n=1 Tax=Paenibacillus TaxID=44249 RepID=UPI000CF8F7C1|nr:MULTISPECIES: hypothetical protein [Paenibacillus]MBJ9993230.1 hypothetical protein [Paenibacillus sp. S28]PQP85979.1 hypothetical protein CPT76_33460 [Paenibacillus sp. AR247]